LVVGAIDGDPGVRPGEHIFTASKAPWYEIADGLPQRMASRDRTLMTRLFRYIDEPYAKA